MTIKLAIASDHAGLILKDYLKANFTAVPVEWVDLGTHSGDSVDYPDYGQKLAEAVAGGGVPMGVGICGSGVGISIACNRNPKIRAALCANSTMARVSRLHNDANVLCLGERITGAQVALDILKAFLETRFEGGRHQGRVDKLS